MLNKDVNLSVLQHHILERIAYVATLVKCIARTILETVWVRNMPETCKYAKLLYLRQESRVW